MTHRPTSDEIAEYFRPPGPHAGSLEALVEPIHDAPISSGEGLEKLCELFSTTEIPRTGVGLQEYADYLRSRVLPHIVNVSHPRFVGHMTSPLPAFQHELSKVLSRWNQNVVKTETSQALTLVERQVVAMMHRLAFQLPESVYQEHTHHRGSCLGVITSGGSLANVTAMWAARGRGLGRAMAVRGHHAPSAELSLPSALIAAGYRDAVIIGSSLVHYSFKKLASLLGIGAANLLTVPADQSGRIDPEAARRLVRRCESQRRMVIAIVGIAGTTETGSVDDLEALSAIAKEYSVHFHVDAAWGGALLFSRRHRHMLSGIEQADSIAICGHKQLYLPQGISLLLLRDPMLAQQIQTQSRYQARPSSLDAGRFTLQGSRPAMALHLHAALRVLGRDGYETLVDRSIALAAEFADLIESSDAFELVMRPQTNIVNYRFLPRMVRRSPHLLRDARLLVDEVNTALQEQQFRAGKSFVSRTTLGQHQSRDEAVVLRAVFANPNTTREDMKSVLAHQLQIGEGLCDELEMMRMPFSKGTHP